MTEYCLKVTNHSHTFTHLGTIYIVSYETPHYVTIDQVTKLELFTSGPRVARCTRALERVGAYRVPLMAWNNFTSQLALQYLKTYVEDTPLTAVPIAESLTHYIPKHKTGTGSKHYIEHIEE